MNRINNWQETLRLANEDLKRYDAAIAVSDDVGFYTIEIIINDERIVFAENYYEDELGESVNDAWVHARLRAQEKKHIDLSKQFPVVTIDREELKTYGLDFDVSDKTMEEIASLMSEWFDDLFEDALLSCARQAGVKRVQQ